MKTPLLSALVTTGLCVVLVGWHMAGTGPSAAPAESSAPAPRPAAAPLVPLSAFTDAALPDPQALMTGILKAGDAETRAALRADFGRSADAESIRRLAALYQDQATSAGQRAHLLEALGVVINPMAAEGLREVALKTEDTALILAATQALAKTGTLEAMIALRDLYRHSRDEQLRVQTLDTFRNCDPLPEARGLLQALSAEAASDPWCLAAGELLTRTPESAGESSQLGMLPQLTPVDKLGSF